MRVIEKVRVRVLLPALIGASLCASPAFAQTDECAKLGQVLSARGKLIEEVQRYEKKRPTAEVACNTFTRLVEATNASIVEIDRNGSWCHVPPEAKQALASQQEGLARAKTNACTAAVQQKKQLEEAKKAPPLLGGGDILGGPMKVPQGAL